LIAKNRVARRQSCLASLYLSLRAEDEKH